MIRVGVDCVEAATGDAMSRRRSSSVEYINDSALTWLFAGLTLIAFIVAGLVGFLRGRTWARQGGPVARLVPRANGMAAACIIAGAVSFGIGMSTGLIH